MGATSTFRHSLARPLSLEHLEGRICLAGDSPACLIESSGQGESARAAHAINCFAVDLYKHFQNEEGNLFLSPTSIATALAMAYAGAAGQTADEMEAVLHLGEPPGIHSSFRDLIASFDRPEAVSGFVLELANAMWPQEGLPLHEDFVRTVEEDYQGTAQNLDYSDPVHAKDVINSWVADKTRGRIQDLIDQLSPATVMVLTNSIYFKSLWASPFDPRHSFDGRFFRDDGGTITVPMMQMTDPAFLGEIPPYPYYTELNGFQILDLPFEDKSTSMVFVLPQGRDGANELSPQLLADVHEWLESPREPVQVDIVLPKFQTSVSSSLKTLLGGMGMPSAFGAADFSAMTDLPVSINKVRHKAFIEVNEQGTEAAAATEVEFFVCFAAGTPVLTPDGEKPIEELKAGDYVLSRSEHDVEGKIEPKRIEETFTGHAEVLNLHVGGQVIRATAVHRFFVKGKGWTPLGQMNAGDLMANDDLTRWLEVEQVTAAIEPQPVYNFRVADHHTYFVGNSEWGFAVWTHNDYLGPVFIADHPFHFFIRDNTTSTLLFMGRIEDPTQSENTLNPSVEPTVEPIAGDFDHDELLQCTDVDALVAEIVSGSHDSRFDLTGDDAVDQQDLARWRELAGAANLPSGASYLSGDANLDGRIDSADLNVVGRNWQQRATGWCGGDFTADSTVDARDLNVLGRNWQKDASAAQIAAQRTPRAPLARAIETQADIDRVAVETISSDEQQEGTEPRDERVTPGAVDADVGRPLRVRLSRFDVVNHRRLVASETSSLTNHNEPELRWQSLVDDSLAIW